MIIAGGHGKEHHAGEEEYIVPMSLWFVRPSSASRIANHVMIVVGVFVGGVFVCHVLYLVENLLLDDGGGSAGRDGRG